MSKYDQTSADGKYEVVYGYDNPLESFYIRVYDIAQRQLADAAAARIDEAFASEQEPSAEDCRLADQTGQIVDLGSLTKELPTIDALVRAAAPYIIIPQETIERLVSDQKNAPGPSSLQRALRR